jgi:Na+/phosphate symporter
MESLKLALSVFISADVKIARQLIEEEAAVRQAERLASPFAYEGRLQGKL